MSEKVAIVFEHWPPDHTAYEEYGPWSVEIWGEMYSGRSVEPLLNDAEKTAYHTLNLLVGSAVVEGVGRKETFAYFDPDIVVYITKKREKELLQLLGPGTVD